jgi:hypothetical protein
MELHQAGLIDFWIQMEVQNNRNANHCLNVAGKKLQQKKSPSFNNQKRINLKNFSGAFYVLIAGYFISLLCFVCENVVIRFKRLSRDDVRT